MQRHIRNFLPKGEFMMITDRNILSQIFKNEQKTKETTCLPDNHTVLPKRGGISHANELNNFEDQN
jgi:hypothetical protein